jgi:hypothetical protein
MQEKFLRPVFRLGRRNTTLNPLPHPVRNVGWEPLVELTEAVWDDEPIVAHEVTVSEGECIPPRGGIFPESDCSKFFGIDHLRNPPDPAKP